MATEKLMDAAASLSNLLDDAYKCLYDQDDKYGAMSDISEMRDKLEILLNELHIYIWLKEDYDERIARVFTSKEDAEEALQADVEAVRNAYGTGILDDSDPYGIAFYGEISEEDVFWSRMYNRDE